jgi:hypothetical protein
MNAENWYTPAKTILLTGAGFTKTFGGYLASEMWAAILNQPEIRNNPKLRMLLISNQNFEDVYEEVLESTNYSPYQQQAFTAAIRRAYEEMDAVIPDCAPEQYAACRYFIRLFADSEDPLTRGFVFTLNQDLFLERYYFFNNSDHRTVMKIPGITIDPSLWFSSSAEPPEKFQVKLPNSNALADYKKTFQTKGTGHFMYVKLHGSYGWQSHDGSDALVIGRGKRGRIAKEPVLSWYLELFNEVLHAGDRNLVVIGYGFGDDHINEIIANAIENSGLRLYVICPMEPEEFKNRLLNLNGFNVKEIKLGLEIWNGLYGYYRNKVTDFYTAHSDSIFPSRGEQFKKNLSLT